LLSAGLTCDMGLPPAGKRSQLTWLACRSGSESSGRWYGRTGIFRTPPGKGSSEADPSRIAGPTVLVVDDLQWAGLATLTILEKLAVTAADLPLVFIGTPRPVAHARAHDQDHDGRSIPPIMDGEVASADCDA
jgi:hypothetical protein